MRKRKIVPVIAPFQGLRYDPKRIKSLALVVTPPYDIISPRQQNQLYRRHPYNFIRVVYGKKRSRDRPGNDVYSRACADLKKWMRLGVLKRDDRPGVYPYEQEYRINGKSHRRIGVIALVSLDSLVYPHEHTFGGPKKDRLELMKAVNASLDPIFGLVPDANSRYQQFLRRACRNRKPAVSFEVDGVRHRLWRITDPAWIRQLAKRLGSKELVIADGHHRFEAAKTYRDERRKAGSGDGRDAPYNFVMFYLSAAGADEPGLLPTHRLVSVRPPARMEIEWLRPGISEKRLEGQAKVVYTHDLKEACEQLLSGRAQAVVAMPPPKLKEVLAHALAGRRMPRKTTYFYPKLLSGLIGYSFGG